ncbi:MAG: YggS family pyridoxal phosphate-dependent enzyme [Candidatus Marinimicrobia bacterium]|nr:YggS family pyridoxal phosphate-dependent enzyme [Candidatus Neomarinimicrobiota bacterium]
MEALNSRIQIAAKKSGRNLNDITLVAVTKSFPQNIWNTALNHNLTTLAESRIQETMDKLNKYKHRDKIELHLIGHLQSNKARKAGQIFDIIQTVDTIKLAKRLNTISIESNKTQKIYLQVNIGNDTKKKGFTPEKIIDSAKEISTLDNIELEGIMTIPPNSIPENNLRELYKKTREIRDEIKKSVNNSCENLSMGMSNDFEIAIEEGATHIRIGTALFGERPL